jgi:uncharacterized membrane protein
MVKYLYTSFQGSKRYYIGITYINVVLYGSGILDCIMWRSSLLWRVVMLGFTIHAASENPNPEHLARLECNMRKTGEIKDTVV